MLVTLPQNGCGLLLHVVHFPGGCTLVPPELLPFVRSYGSRSPRIPGVCGWYVFAPCLFLLVAPLPLLFGSLSSVCLLVRSTCDPRPPVGPRAWVIPGFRLCRASGWSRGTRLSHLVPLSSLLSPRPCLLYPYDLL